MTIAVCILAKDEAKNIGALLEQLSRQTLFAKRGAAIEVHVVANGCTDDTAAVAASHEQSLSRHGGKLHTYDIHPGGKSRAWNRMVHEFAGAGVDMFVFCDADIELVDDIVLEEMVQHLEGASGLKGIVGYPLKDVTRKQRKSVIDRLSLAVSRQTRHQHAISGQLYVIKGDSLRQIWLPDETPGEDGFLNAMMNTDGFTRVRSEAVLREHDRPTHYFEDLRPSEFIRHERRLIVGTMINRWIFEYLWSLKLSTPAGVLIRDWNDREPDWVERIVRERATGRRWLIPNAIVFGRFKFRSDQSTWRTLAFLPLAVAATLMTVPPALSANRMLKRSGAAKVW